MYVSNYVGQKTYSFVPTLSYASVEVLPLEICNAFAA